MNHSRFDKMLPLELQQAVVKFTPAKDAVATASACRHFRELFQNAAFSSVYFADIQPNLSTTLRAVIRNRPLINLEGGLLDIRSSIKSVPIHRIDAVSSSNNDRHATIIVCPDRFQPPTRDTIGWGISADRQPPSDATPALMSQIIITVQLMPKLETLSLNVAGFNSYQKTQFHLLLASAGR